MKNLFFALAILQAIIVIASDGSPPYKLSVSPPEVLLSAETRKTLHLPFFPDGSPAFMSDGKQIVIFASQGGPRDSKVAGTIRLSGTLDNPKPDVLDASGNPIPSLRPGIQEPSPDGRDFDRDYAGGGPVYFDVPSQTLFQVYHGEFHFDPAKPMKFYTSLGIAASKDFGRTFTKLGEIIEPNRPRSDGELTDSSSGSLVKKGDYLYVYYSDSISDTSQFCGKFSCLAVARTKIDDLVSAYKNNKAAEWKKFYLGDFTEPGIGGRFTNLITPVDGRHWIRWPVVAYNDYLKSYIMAYSAGISGIGIRTSLDGMKWGNPTTVFTPSSGESFNYVGMSGTGSFPGILGQEFWVYYSSGFLNWPTATWNRFKVTISPGSSGN